MKIRLHFKMPDAVRDALDEAKQEMLESLEDLDPYSPAHEDALEKVYDELDEIEEALGKYIRYGESMIVEFDSESSSMTVVPVEE